MAVPSAEPLYPKGSPEVTKNGPQDVPALTWFPAPASNNTGVAIVVMPGGCYFDLGMEPEGYAPARLLAARGITAIVLRYRVASGGYHHPAPMRDALRAVRTVRADARKYGIDPAKVGVMGFSAGGHLAGTAATKFTPGDSGAADPVERVSSRPDFVVLCYAVLVLDRPGVTHGFSQSNLLGPNPPAGLAASLSIPDQVTKATPPSFIWTTTEDGLVPAENSIEYYLACRKAHVPAELHVYAKGNHADGVRFPKKFPGTADWLPACVRWLGAMKFIP